MNWEEKSDKLLSDGVVLNHFGNRGFDREKALEVVDRLALEGIAVCGGDVHVVTEAGIEYDNSNWYCNSNEGESNAEFVARCALVSKTYISSYPSTSKQVLFELVPITMEWIMSNHRRFSDPGALLSNKPQSET